MIYYKSNKMFDSHNRRWAVAREVKAKELQVTEARSNLGEIITQAYYAGDRFVIKRRGKPLAAICSIKDLERLERLEREEDARKLRRAMKRTRGLTPIEALTEKYEAKLLEEEVEEE